MATVWVRQSGVRALTSATETGHAPDAAPALADAFRGAMRRLAASVTIVTAGGAADRGGFAATAVCSVSVEPPALLVCVNANASLHDRLTMGALFCVNLLAAQHAELASVFGGKVAPSDRFGHGDWAQDAGGTVYLTDAQANLFCMVDGLLAYGTHMIVVGRVQHVRLCGEAAPLIYSDGRFVVI